MMEYKKFSFHMSSNRIEALTDGIFAIAMTLLVLALAVPDIAEPLSNAAVQNALYGIIPSLYTLILSFILLALFWNIHHRVFQRIKQVNNILLWINMIWLLFVVLVPFSASLTGKYGQFPISHAVFNINMLGISIFLFLNSVYAHSSGAIDDRVDPRDITLIKRDNLTFIVISLIALSLSFIVPRYSALVYLLIFPIEFLTHRI
ncbi:MAG: TMEM175 family protein [Methanobacterium sp.]